MSSSKTDVAIIGAGVAGLSAAYMLKKAGINVLILEAQNRVGGRVFTKHLPHHMQVELGAEFIHGTNWQQENPFQKDSFPSVFAENACILKRPIGSFKLIPADFQETVTFLEKMENYKGEDCSVEDWIKKYLIHKFPLYTIERFRRYIEGYNAADITKISIQALIKSQQEAPESSGVENYRFRGGYDTLIHWLTQQIEMSCILLNTLAKRISWKPGSVQISVRNTTLDKTELIESKYLISTLPIGVEKSSPSAQAHLQFEPSLTERQHALACLEMGNAIRVTLEFKESFIEHYILPHAQFMKYDRIGIIDDTGPFFWWTNYSNGQLFWVAWLSGIKTEQFKNASNDALVSTILEHFAIFFDLSTTFVKENFTNAYYHRWEEDPYALGAYSYVAVGGLSKQQQLYKPIEKTLFFAGEAIPPSGPTGLVTGAIASGIHAAESILNLLN